MLRINNNNNQTARAFSSLLPTSAFMNANEQCSPAAVINSS